MEIKSLVKQKKNEYWYIKDIRYFIQLEKIDGFLKNYKKRIIV